MCSVPPSQTEVPASLNVELEAPHLTLVLQVPVWALEGTYEGRGPAAAGGIGDAGDAESPPPLSLQK